ncbi:MAG: hypothetical protein JO127_12430 [Caulobacteraceae bacterium]|nr:hypothetical protein [Caulobacteraceae bacterium]
MAWIENGPVSLPPPRLAYLAGGLIFLCALAGAGLGFNGSWRNSRPVLGGAQAPAEDQATTARPIVEIPTAPPPAEAANTAADNSAKNADDDTDDSNDIASQTAAAQAVQSRPSRPANIDDILTSRSEKPQAPAKPSSDESPPSDVPF